MMEFLPNSCFFWGSGRIGKRLGQLASRLLALHHALRALGQKMERGPSKRGWLLLLKKSLGKGREMISFIYMQ